jgi:transcriptional regulator with XRE-family HTH domain
MADANQREAVQRRYEDAIRIAEQWLEKQGRSQAFLAQQLGVDRSVLSRFLHRRDLYTPDPSRPRTMQILEGIERICAARPRDIFLSHRSSDKAFVRQLAADLEAETFQGQAILTWLDEAEIRPGQSIPGMINDGLENSRFVALIMTPAYFEKGSGWTDAEWHAALHNDPDNRKARLLPLLLKDCPYIPTLLRHLNAIDLRGDKYPQGLQLLLRVLREEPLPRPITYRGQLVTPGARIDRSTLIAERAVPQADPDVVSERLYCNLLPVEQIPSYIYTAPIAPSLYRTRADGTEAMPTKQELKDAIRAAQEAAQIAHPFVPAFRRMDDRIFTFHDLESPDGPFATVISSDEVEVIRAGEFLRDEDERKILISLLNMAIDRHATRIGLTIDPTKQRRYFFPPKDGGANILWWIPKSRKAPRTVAKPCMKEGEITFWRHQAAYLRMLFLANKLYLQITPTWVITENGVTVSGGPRVGKLIIKWTGPERNLQILYHIRFWTSVLRRGRGPISIRAGDQRIEIATVPAFIQETYGIAHDQRDLLGLLDQEASMIADREEELADLALQAGLPRDNDAIDDDEITEQDWPEEQQESNDD